MRIMFNFAFNEEPKIECIFIPFAQAKQDSQNSRKYPWNIYSNKIQSTNSIRKRVLTSINIFK